MRPVLDDIDRQIVNLLQDGLEVVPEPFAAPAAAVGISQDELLRRLSHLINSGVLSRVGPMFNAVRFGGGLTLCAMAVPEERFDEVADIVNGFDEVAHNYARDHRYNMWFVLATEREDQIAAVIQKIERLTDIKVLNLPKQTEYFVGLRVEA